MLDQFEAFQGAEHEPFLWNGGRQAAVLVHGFPGTPAEMRPIASALHAAGYTVEGVLLPGFGSDIANLNKRQASDWLNAVEQSLADLRRDHDSILLVGNSMGAAICLQVAARQPVAGLVLLSPFWRLSGSPLIRGLWPLLRRVFPEFRPFRLFKPDFDKPEVRAGISEFMPGIDLDDPAVRQAILEFSIPTRIIDEAVGTGQQAFEIAPTVFSPALVLQGAEDALVKPERTRELVARLSGPVTYRELAGGHDLAQADRPAWPEVERLTLAFVQNIGTVTQP